ncbi:MULTISPECIES: Crp/Fnr family transcriptional regulator [unclassified Lysinibacillus]|uniref:Crp/Fnr family transcriptional regulator n=1 Tax=unclassified Lysinibacillus TaxID=2636778 RepID=UPI001F0DEC5C|nr:MULTISPECIES: Crp/Fnr family transcriptional regulator [unclassified Lysinibacillus]
MIFIETVQTIPQDIAILCQTKGTIFKLEKGATIFQEGERAEHIFLIKSGSVQVSKETESGRELTIRICGKDCLIGESLMFCKFTSHSTTAKALEASEIYSIHNDLLESFIQDHPTLMVDYLKWIQTENIKNQSRLRDLVLHGKKGALFSTLIRLANTYGKFSSVNEVFISIALTNTEIANLCATSREMINRMLNDLRKDKIIKIDRGYITILDLNYLKQEIDCENCPLAVCRID